MIGVSEGTSIITSSDHGYNVIVGSTEAHPDLFDSYADHPRKRVYFPKLGIYSSAAGKYQDEPHWFDAYKKLLNLPDFSPDSQDKIAIRQISERGALGDIEAGQLVPAINKCANIWASFPGNTYKQHVQQLNFLTKAFIDAGGTVAT